MHSLEGNTAMPGSCMLTR